MREDNEKLKMGLRELYKSKVDRFVDSEYDRWAQSAWNEWCELNRVDPKRNKEQEYRTAFKRWLTYRETTHIYVCPAPPVARCGSKIIYDKKGAQSAKKHREGSGSPDLRIYECNHCKGWHLTSKPYMPK